MTRSKLVLADLRPGRGVEADDLAEDGRALLHDDDELSGRRVEGEVEGARRAQDASRAATEIKLAAEKAAEETLAAASRTAREAEERAAELDAQRRRIERQSAESIEKAARLESSATAAEEQLAELRGKAESLAAGVAAELGRLLAEGGLSGEVSAGGARRVVRGGAVELGAGDPAARAWAAHAPT